MTDTAAPRRSCSKQTCNRDAVCTLTYVYSDSTAVIGALSARREPHAYDLCPVHADTLTAPRGWRVVRLEAPGGWDRDDLDDVVQAVRRSEEPAVRRTPGRGPSLGAVRPGAPQAPAARVLRDVSYRGGDGTATTPDEATREDRGTPGTAGTARENAPDEHRSDRGATGSDGPRAGAAGPHGPTPNGVLAGSDDGYSEPTPSVAKAHHPSEPSSRSVPMPKSLRTPHWRRP